MSVLDDRYVLFEDEGNVGSPRPGPLPFSVERVRDRDGDQIHVIVGEARTVFDSDRFLEILRKLHWAVAIDRGLALPKPGQES